MIHFCHSDGCEFCARMPERAKRVQEYIESNLWEHEKNVLSQEIRLCQSTGSELSPAAFVDYLLQERQAYPARVPWNLNWAREWLDRERPDLPQTNLER